MIPAKIIEPGSCKLKLSFNEGSGTVATDSTGNNNGTVVGNPTWIPGGGLTLNGSSQYVNFGNVLNAGTDDLSWVFRFKTTGSGTMMVINKSSTYGLDIYFGFGGAGKIGCRLYVDASNFRSLGTANAYNDGNEHHAVVTVTRSTGTISFMIDGVAVATANAASGGVITGNSTNTDLLNIGRRNSDGALYYSGDLKDIRHYRRALTTTEALTLSRGGEVYDPVGTSLKLWLPMQEGSGATTVDRSGNGNNGTLINSPTWVDGRTGRAVRNNGANSYITIANNSNLTGMSNLTILAWINKRTKDIKIAGKWVAGGFSYIFRESSGSLQGYANGVGGNLGIVPKAGWHFYAMVYNGANIVGYMDAVAGSTPVSVTGVVPNSSSALIIGAEYELSAPSDQDTEQFMIFNRALSAKEIAAMYFAKRGIQ